MGTPVRSGPSGRDGLRCGHGRGRGPGGGPHRPVGARSRRSARRRPPDRQPGGPVRRPGPPRPGPRGRGGPALGADVVSVAARNGTNPSELAEHLRADRTLWVDECGALFFQDELPADLEPARRPRRGPAGPTVVAPADAFGLHSRPGSQRVLYLDFDGHRDLRDRVEQPVRTGHVDGAGLLDGRRPHHVLRRGAGGRRRRLAPGRPGLRTVRRRRHDRRIRGRMRSPAPGPRTPSSAPGC